MAGVSPAAVSRAFQPGGSISPKKREAVLHAAEALHYRPNLLAKSLLTGRSGLVALVMKHLDNQFYPPLVESLATSLAAQGYRMLVFIADTLNQSDEVMESLLRYRVEAAIMLSTLLSDRSADACGAAGVPVLLINCRIDSRHVSCITADNWNASRTVAAFLVAGGHSHCAILTGLAESSTSQERQAGFASYFHDQGLPAPTAISGEYDYALSAAATRTLLSSPTPPDAIFCGNDHMAAACMGVAQGEFGLRIGEQLSIVGFDNTPMAAWPMIRLTTVAQPVDEMTRRTLAALETMLDGPGQSTLNITIPGTLIVRTSARRPKTGCTKHGDITTWHAPRKRRSV